MKSKESLNKIMELSTENIRDLTEQELKFFKKERQKILIQYDKQ